MGVVPLLGWRLVRLATWNVNSIRSRAPQLQRWLVERQIDVALLQETKCGDGDFPFAALEDLGYEVAHHGVDHWNGVAIVSRVGLDEVARGFTADLEAPFDEPRVIAATCQGVRCWSVYVPNGRAVDDPHFAFKLAWLGYLRDELERVDATSTPALVAGDFNIGRADLDFYDPKRWKNRKHATPEERAALDEVIDVGLADLARHCHSDTPEFTWWNYVGTQFAKNKGLRIDLALGSPHVVDRIDDVWVDRVARDPLRVAPAKPSDHAPLIVDLV